MPSLIDTFFAIRARHTSATSALTDPVLEGKHLGAVKELLEILRDTPLALFQVESRERLFRLPATATTKALRDRIGKVGQKLLRREPRRVDGYNPFPHRQYDMVSVRTLVERTAELWSKPASLQPLLTQNFPTRTILGVQYPWYGDERYLTLQGDGFVMGTFHVVESDAGGPTKVRIIRRDDPQFQADIAASTTICPSIRAERQDMTKGGPDFNYRPEVCAHIRRLGLDAVLDVGRLPEVYRVLLCPYSDVGRVEIARSVTSTQPEPTP